jgi:regulator of replication initiation timing
MLQPLMVLLAAASLGAAGATTAPPHCTVDTGSVRITVLRHEDCAELTRLREERERLRQRLSEVRAQAGEEATGGSGEEAQAEPPPPEPVEARPPVQEARPPVQESAVTEELRALRREVSELRQSLKEAEARLAVPAAPAKAEAAPVREEPSEREEALELLRNTDVLTVESANPAERQVLGQVNVANRTQTGEVGFVLEPQVRVGTPWKVEFGAGAQLQNLAGEQDGTTGAVEAYALGQLVEEKDAVPMVALWGQVTSPQGDEGVSAEARVLATKTFGQTRLHGNVGYSARQDTADDYLLGLAADHPIGDRLLLQGDAYYVNPLGDEEASVNASVGTGLRVGSAFVVTGAVGVNARAADVAPRLLFGVLGRI